MLAGQTVRMFQLKAVSNVVCSLTLAERGLWWGVAAAPKDAGRHGPTGVCAKTATKESCLVVAPLGQTVGMQGNGHHQSGP